MFNPTESFDIIPSKIDQAFHIKVAFPGSYFIDEDAKFRINYVTDGELAFGIASGVQVLAQQDMHEMEIGEAVTVGIFFDDAKKWAHDRTLHFTPRPMLDDWFIDMHDAMIGKPVEQGGATAFLDFIVNELHAEICRRYRVVEDSATLMSNSMGGVFSFFAFMQNPALFDRYWIGSPAIFGVGQSLIEDLDARLQQGFDRPMRVFLSSGEWERTRPTEIMPGEMYQGIADSVAKIDAKLSKVNDPNFLYEYVEFEGEGHNGVLVPALNRAHRFLNRMDEDDDDW